MYIVVFYSFFNENLTTGCSLICICKYCAPWFQEIQQIKTMMGMFEQILQITASCACNGDYCPIIQANTTIINTHRMTCTAAYTYVPEQMYKEKYTLKHNANLFLACGLGYLKDPSYSIRARTWCELGAHENVKGRKAPRMWKTQRLTPGFLLSLVNSPFLLNVWTLYTCCDKIPLLVSNMRKKQDCTCLQTQMFSF